MTSRRYLPALRSNFGDWRYYSCLMSMSEVVDRIGYAKEVYKSKGLSELVQRALEGDRAKNISEYLENNEQRFFNSLVIAVVGGDPNWHGFSDFKPVRDDLDPNILGDDIRDKVGFLSFDGSEKMFALDGQHRLAGMKLAVEKGIPASLDAISLIFVAHKETKLGRIRTRNLFTTLNKTAVPVGKGDRIALDESDAMAIVARYLVEESKIFSDEKILVTARDNLPVSNFSNLTTIGNLYEVLTEVFSKIKEKKSKTELKYKRPTEEQISEYINFGENFFLDLGDHFPEFKEYLESKKPESVIKKYRNELGGHILFRPAGLRLVTEVIAHLMQVERLEYETALEQVSLIPTSLVNEPYKGVLWLNEQKRMNTGKRSLCRQLLLYMLNAKKGYPVDIRDKYALQLGTELSMTALPKKII